MRYLIIFILLNINQLIYGQCSDVSSSKILLVGDSWLHFPFLYQTHERVFREFGFSDVKVAGEKTVIGGTVSTNWIMGNGRNFITNALNFQPDINIVVISVGGNDLIYEIRSGMSEAASQAIIDKQDAATRSLIDMIRNIRPDVSIMLCGYDYPNLLEVIQNPPPGKDESGVNGIYQMLFQITGQPDQEFVNSVLIRLEASKQQIANDYRDVVYVPTLGLMQNIYGYDSIFCSKYPSFPSNQVAVPGGDPRYPSPQKAMGYNGADAIHLSDEGFMNWVRYHSKQYFLPRFRNFPELSLKAEIENENGTIISDGTVLQNQPQIGDRLRGANFKTIVSFDIQNRPDLSAIEEVVLCLKRKNATSFYPVLLDNPFFKIEIADNFFGNSPVLEAADYSAPAAASAVVCARGNTAQNGDVIRIRLSKEMIQKIPAEGKIQFRLSLPANGGNISKDEYIEFYGAGEEDYFAPYLDINARTSTGIVLTNAEPLQIFPNPIQSGERLQFRLPSSDQSWKVTVMDIQGRIIFEDITNEILYHLQTMSWNSGVYIVQAVSGKSRLTGKCIVQ